MTTKKQKKQHNKDAIIPHASLQTLMGISYTKINLYTPFTVDQVQHQSLRPRYSNSTSDPPARCCKPTRDGPAATHAWCPRGGTGQPELFVSLLGVGVWHTPCLRLLWLHRTAINRGTVLPHLAGRQAAAVYVVASWGNAGGLLLPRVPHPTATQANRPLPDLARPPGVGAGRCPSK